MKPIARPEFDKVGHRRSEEMSVRWPRLLPHIHVGFHDNAIFIDVISVEAGAVVVVFADDPETTRGSFISFTTGRNSGIRNLHSAFEKDRMLLA